MHIEAIEDGIRFIPSEKHGDFTKYFVKCNLCGEEMVVVSYRRDVKYTCKACKLQNYLNDRENREVENSDEKYKKFENAITRINKKNKGNEQDYYKAIEIVRKNINKPGWFQSTEEMMVALELLKNNISTRHQVKFGNYRADFVLPDEKIVLEVDGEIYHTKEGRKRESIRDNLMVSSLGSDWEIVRIECKLINQNITKLVKAMRAVKESRRRIRLANKGELPYWYTDRIQ